MTEPRAFTIVVLGDSTAHGLGVAGHAYADQVAALLRADLKRDVIVHNFAKSASQIDESLTKLPAILELDPDFVVIAHGVSEAIIRPSARAMKRVPRRWQQAGWLDPRPYFSARLLKGAYQCIESVIRWRVKVCLIRLSEPTNWMARNDFENHTREALRTLLSRSRASIILLSSLAVDEEGYPGSPQSLKSFRRALASVAEAEQFKQRVTFVDISGSLDQWGDYFHNRFHPNRSGHQKIAERLFHEVLSFSPCKPLDEVI